MLGNRPLLGAALGSIELPPGIEDPITAIAKTRGAEFAVIFEVTGFPKQFAGASGGATPLLGAPLLSSIGIAGEEIVQDLSPLTLWLSDYSYRTKPSDIVLPNMWTEPRMTRRADIEQTAPVAQGGSRSAQTTTGDVEFADGAFSVVGTDRKLALKDVARAAFQPAMMRSFRSKVLRSPSGASRFICLSLSARRRWACCSACLRHGR